MSVGLWKRRGSQEITQQRGAINVNSVWRGKGLECAKDSGHREGTRRFRVLSEMTQLSESASKHWPQASHLKHSACDILLTAIAADAELGVIVSLTVG